MNVRLRPEIGELPEHCREALLTAILEANHLYRGTGGATLALEPGAPRLLIQKYTWFERLDSNTVFETLANFSATVASWRGILSDYSPAADEDTPISSASDFLRV